MKKFYFGCGDAHLPTILNIVILACSSEEAMSRLRYLFPAEDIINPWDMIYTDFTEISEADAL